MHHRSPTANLTPRLVAIVLFVALANVISGYDTLSFNGLQAIPAFARQFGVFDRTLGTYALPAPRSSLLTSIAFVGRLVGTILGGPCVEKYGHRTGIFVLCSSTMVGAVIQITARNVAQFLVGRIVVFIGVGFIVNVIPTYQSEILPASARGFFVSSAEFILLLGAVAANGVNRIYSTSTTTEGWVIPVAVQLITPAIILCGLPFIPPSPRWLVYKGRRDDAIRVLESVRTRADVQAGLCAEEVSVIEELCSRQGLEKKPWADLFRGTNCRRTGIAIAIFLYHQLTGQAFVSQYATVFYIREGLGAKSFTYTIIAPAVSSVACLGAMYLVDTLGRRPMLVGGAFLQALWLLLVGGMGSLPHASAASKHMVVAATTLYTLSYSASWSSLSYVIAAEIGTGALREKTMALSSSVDAVAGFVVSFTLPYLLNPPYADLQAKVGYIYGSIAASGMLYALLFVPETKGRTLEELDELFGHRPGLAAWRFGEFKTAGGGARIAELEKTDVEGSSPPAFEGDTGDVRKAEELAM